MSQSFLKFNKYEVFNLLNYFDLDNILNNDDKIIEVIQETSSLQYFYCFTILLSSGKLLYLEYNIRKNKITKFIPNFILCSLLSTKIEFSDLSNSTPLLISTNKNELLYIDSKIKPQQIITLTAENIQIFSVLTQFEITSIKFSPTQSFILVITKENVSIYKLIYDKYEQKNMLINTHNIDFSFCNISKFLPDSIDFSFSSYNENELIYTIRTKSPFNEIIDSSLKINIDNSEIIYFYIGSLFLLKKEFTNKIYKSFIVDSSFIMLKSSFLNDKLFFLLKNGIISCNYINKNENKKDIEKDKDKKNEKNKKQENDNNYKIFKYSLNSNITFIDLLVHPSSNFILVMDELGDFLVFDFTLNLYSIINNSKMNLKISIPFLREEKENEILLNNNEENYQSGERKIKEIFIKGNELYHAFQLASNIEKKQDYQQNSFEINSLWKSNIKLNKIRDNFHIIYNSNNIFILNFEISSNINKNSLSSNIINEYLIIKNHLKGLNFESAFSILTCIDNFNLWIYSFLFIINKMCQSPNIISSIKRYSFNEFIESIKEKKFQDEYKDTTSNTIKSIGLSNLLYRFMSIKQYEYAYVIAEKYASSNMLKIILSHSKQTRFLGIAYLCCHRLEEMKTDHDDTIANEINKIFFNSNFVMSQQNLKNVIKDLDYLLENNNLNNDYFSDCNPLEINLNKYLEGLNCEMEGRFEEAKEIYKKNGLNYDYSRVEKLYTEFKNNFKEDSMHELNDI